MISLKYDWCWSLWLVKHAGKEPIKCVVVHRISMTFSKKFLLNEFTGNWLPFLFWSTFHDFYNMAICKTGNGQFAHTEHCCHFHTAFSRLNNALCVTFGCSAVNLYKECFEQFLISLFPPAIPSPKKRNPVKNNSEFVVFQVVLYKWCLFYNNYNTTCGIITFLISLGFLFYAVCV